MNAHEPQQPYILLKPDHFQFNGHFHALQSLENVQHSASESFDSKKRNNSEGKRQKPLAMSRRNARERRRVKLINLGYETLRHHVPAGIENKKLSKVETLRAAVDYIKHLQNLLESEDSFVFETTFNSHQGSSALSENPGVSANRKCTLSCSGDSQELTQTTIKQEILDNTENCSMTSCDGNAETRTELVPKEDNVFIDIAKWLCQNSDSIKHNNFKFKGILNESATDHAHF